MCFIINIICSVNKEMSGSQNFWNQNYFIFVKIENPKAILFM